MSVRKIWICCLVVVACILGAVVWQNAMSEVKWVRGVWDSGYALDDNEPNKEFYDGMPKEQLLVLGRGTPEELLEYGKQHPEHPWLL